jgi:hypothetical protein
MRFVIGHLRRHTVGYVALFVALGGGAYAATALPANSVGSVQVRNHSLLGVDFRAGQIPAGKRGVPGPAGTFDASHVTAVGGPLATLCPLGAGDCAVGTSTAECPGASVPLSGGWVPLQENALIAATVVFNGPDGDHAWSVMTVNNLSAFGGAFEAVAICGSGGTAPFAHRARARLDALRQSVLRRLDAR